MRVPEQFVDDAIGKPPLQGDGIRRLDDLEIKRGRGQQPLA